MPVTMLLVLTFWLPPLMVGYWFVYRSRMLVSLVVALVWALVWAIASFFSLPTYVPHGPSDPFDAPAYVMLGLMIFAVVIVLPGSALFCLTGTWLHKLYANHAAR
jgi:hypothetical protein